MNKLANERRRSKLKQTIDCVHNYMKLQEELKNIPLSERKKLYKGRTMRQYLHDKTLISQAVVARYLKLKGILSKKEFKKVLDGHYSITQALGIVNSGMKLSNVPTHYQGTYLIKNKSNGFYKIGRTNNLYKRARTLQSEEPLIEYVKFWSYDIESKLHEMYKRQNIRGEWYWLNKIQVRYICTHH